MSYREAWRALPQWIKYLLAVAVALSWVPLAFIARARVATSPRPRIHLVPDMDNQPRYEAQQANPLFADGRAMRPPVPGTVAVEDPVEPGPLETGRDGDGWVAVNPLPVTLALLERGRERFGIHCAPCHGLDGYGDGIVAVRAERLQEGTWVPPASLHTGTVRSRPDGRIFDTITHGTRNMPAYGAQIPVRDRWAIVAYVRALQRSQHATLADVPPEVRDRLR